MALGSIQPLNRNECQEYSCADYHEIWEPQPSRTLRACTGFALPFTLRRTSLSILLPIHRSPVSICHYIRAPAFIIHKTTLCSILLR